MPRPLQRTLPYAGGLLGLAALTVASVLALEVYASPGFAVSAAFLKLCGL